MGKLPFEKRHLTADERECLELGIDNIETVTSARVVAILLMDDDGLAISMRGGIERHVVRLLQDIDWTHARMVTDEHIA